MIYYIGFFKYDDSQIYMRSQLTEDKEALQQSLESMEYVNKASIQIKEIELL